MRPIERIPIFLDEFIKQYEIDKKVLSKLKKYWLKNQDLRFTQVLVNLGLIENYPGTWYYMEDLEMMLKVLNMKPRDCVLWGTFGKSGTDLLRYVLLRDMTNAHIEAILETQKKINPYYREYFEIELEYRKKNGINLVD